MTQPTIINSCTAAVLDSCASRTNRLSKNATTALIIPSALSSKPEWPAGLRDGKLPLLISGAFELTPEDQTQHESNSERREYCLCWIFTHVFLGVFLERTSAAGGIAPCLFCFAPCFAPSLLRFSAVLFGESTCG